LSRPERRVRILLVTEASGSGTLGVVTTLAAGMSRAGHAVTLAYGARPETPADLRERLPREVELVALPWTRRTPRAQLAAARALRTLSARVQPDVVHLHSSFAGAVGALALRGVPLVYTPHGYAFGRSSDHVAARAAYRTAERLIARRCHVAAVSEAEAALARDVLGAPRVTVVPNGIPDLEDPALPGDPIPARDEPLVVGAGRIAPQRRPDASARILGAVADVAGVAWIGDAPGGEAEPLHAAGIPVTGWLSHEDALAQLGRATVLLNYSAWDGAPLAVLEAMARDVVVVASDIPAHRELLGPEQICADEAAATRLIRAVLGDPALRARLLAGQRERAGSRGAGRMVEQCLELYSRVLGTPSRSRPVATASVARTIESGPWT
jgi:glycosyltransferase involved in cell wall biosynthesis